jgi:hypothetical protein
MKKFFLIFLAIIVLLFLGLTIFNRYNATHVMDNQAVFNVYLRMSPQEVDHYFGKKDGFYDENKHDIICELPVKSSGFKGNSTTLYPSTSIQINCDESYDELKHNKYDNTEFLGNRFVVYLVRKLGAPAFMFDSNRAVFQKSIVGARHFTLKYKRGAINNIVITPDSSFLYCPIEK